MSGIKRKKSDSGTTLIEVLIASFVSGLVLASMLFLVLFVQKAESSSFGRTFISLQVTKASEFIARHVRVASRNFGLQFLDPLGPDDPDNYRYRRVEFQVPQYSGGSITYVESAFYYDPEAQIIYYVPDVNASPTQNIPVAYNITQCIFYIYPPDLGNPSIIPDYNELEYEIVGMCRIRDKVYTDYVYSSAVIRTPEPQ